MMQKTKLAAAVMVATLGLAACGGSSNNTPAPTPTPTNSAPTDITLSNSSVKEREVGAVIGTLGATDADSGDTFTFSIKEGSNAEIDGTTLKLKADVAVDYEKNTSFKVEILVKDKAGASFMKEFTINVEDVLDYYNFASKGVAGESSVSYSGQTARHLLISELSKLINTDFADVNAFSAAGKYTTRSQVMDALNSYYDVPDYTVLSERTLLTTTTPAAQTKLSDISSSSKNLKGKTAGNDAKGQHKDWSTAFEGWGAKGSTTPEGLVRTLFGMLADNVNAQLAGGSRNDPFGNAINTLYLTDDGRDLKQLIQKFLLMAVGFSQGADDYLDNDLDNHGLNSDNISFGSKNYTELEHKFDEGFGYFGAARNYLDYSDDEIAGKGGRDGWKSGYNDTDGNGAINFKSEYNFGQAVNAAKRDRKAKVATDMTKDAMEAFLKARKLINDASGTALTDAQKTELVGYRDAALLAWEKSISATVVHYINDTIADLDKIGTAEFKYADLAKHWSEMKGFALGLQFNPHSPVTDAQFTQLHGYFGDKPATLTDAAAVTAYKADLLLARKILQDAYSFDEQNVANW